MKTQKEIHKFYAKTILPDLKDLELTRRKIHAVLKVVLWILLASWIPLAILMTRFMEGWIEGVRTTAILLFITYAIFYAILTRNFTKQVTQHVEGRLLRFLLSDLHLYPKKKIEKGTFKRSGLFLKKITKYRGQNLTTGRIGNTRIEFSEIEATGQDSDGDHTVFEGLFFVADFNKHFQGRTFVLPDVAENLFGSFGQVLQSINQSRPPLVKLENPEFEKQFVVYSEDQIEARYILSPAFMDRMVAFQTQYQNCVYISFAGSRIFIAIRSLYPLFSPSVYTSLFDYDQIKKYCEILQMALDVVDSLNLNTRIWTKE